MSKQTAAALGRTSGRIDGALQTRILAYAKHVGAQHAESIQECDAVLARSALGRPTIGGSEVEIEADAETLDLAVEASGVARVGEAAVHDEVVPLHARVRVQVPVERER